MPEGLPRARPARSEAPLAGGRSKDLHSRSPSPNRRHRPAIRAHDVSTACGAERQHAGIEAVAEPADGLARRRTVTAAAMAGRACPKKSHPPKLPDFRATKEVLAAVGRQRWRSVRGLVPTLRSHLT
jgi:hypothetical protein